MEEADEEEEAGVPDHTDFGWDKHASKRATAELGVCPDEAEPEVGGTTGPEVWTESAELDDSGGTHLTEVGYSAVGRSARAALRVTVPDSAEVVAGSTITSTGLTPESSAESDKGAIPRDRLSTRG
ncbi:hypothetical protein PF010_g29333 [Phytophthora fragariae]|uniref:Uncharacterized protein n=1 Tax=Phytophthora fragariae TaxID=53985 RepID=A0A6G0JP60_9STRA|nr:hypothetical protein PF010_g29333 [Phytophthora fragariae]KAE9167546.1 hypothetical protein PF004_g28793 [Phytophthora fragariae]